MNNTDIALFECIETSLVRKALNFFLVTPFILLAPRANPSRSRLPRSPDTIHVLGSVFPPRLTKPTIFTGSVNWSPEFFSVHL